VQGAFCSLTALAYAFGPCAMRFVQNHTKDDALVGKGSMFVASAGMYATAVVCSYMLPVRLVFVDLERVGLLTINSAIVGAKVGS
jgi:hypothetical protein